MDSGLRMRLQGVSGSEGREERRDEAVIRIGSYGRRGDVEGQFLALLLYRRSESDNKYN